MRLSATNLGLHMGEEDLDLNGVEEEFEAAVLDSQVHEAATKSFLAIAKLGQVTPGNRWAAAASKVTAVNAARELRDAARLKALQRTPYPMILSRIRTLLDKIQETDNISTLSRGSHYTQFTSFTSRGGHPSASAPATPAALHREHSLASPRGGPYSTRSLRGAAPQCPATPRSPSSEEKLVAELSLILSFVSEFMRKVPAEVRAQTCEVARLEGCKKDAVIHRIGDDPEKLYLVLTGTLEVWTHPPANRHAKVVVTQLRRGNMFGDVAILNNEPQQQCVTALSPCTFLTVERQQFLDVFGLWFKEEQRQASAFLLHHVPALQKCTAEQLAHVARHMQRSSYQEGSEWEPASQQLVFFVISGQCTLEAVDRKAAVNVPLSALKGDTTTPTLAAEGVLADVELHAGRAVGTLGKEAELKRLRAALTPKKVIASLLRGAYFGGGTRLLGEGEYQNGLKVVAYDAVELYHIHIDQLCKYAGLPAISALRDDTAFKMTYSHGKVGAIGMDTIVGHPDNSFLRKLSGEEQADATGKKRKRKGKQAAKVEVARQPGQQQYSPGTVAVIEHIQAVQQEMRDREASVSYCFGTPAERYHQSSDHEGPAPMVPLLQHIYPDGLQPLTEKVDALTAKSCRHTLHSLQRPGTAATRGLRASLTLLESYADPALWASLPHTPCAPLEPTSDPTLPTASSPPFPRLPDTSHPSSTRSQARQPSSSTTSPSANPSSPHSTPGNRSPHVVNIISFDQAPSSTSSSSHPPDHKPGSRWRPPGISTLSSSLDTGFSSLSLINPVGDSTPTASPSPRGNTLPSCRPSTSPGFGSAGSLPLRGRLVVTTSTGRLGTPSSIASGGSGTLALGLPPGCQRAPRSYTRPGGLTAAAVMWEHMSSGPTVPGLRQCLTYEEIARQKCDLRESILRGTDPPIQQQLQQQHTLGSAPSGMPRPGQVARLSQTA